MGRSYYIFSSGSVKRKENTILVEIEGEKSTVKKSIPVENVEQIYFFGEITLNSKFLDFASKNSIVIHFFNYYGFYTGSFYPREHHKTGYLIVKQVQHYLDPEKRMNIARKFVEGALHNIRRIIEKRECEDTAKEIDEYRNLLKNASTPADLMVHEAHARRAYYSVWSEITGWKFSGRKMHPPSDELNALISFGNSLLYTGILKELYKTPLDPTVSYLHEPNMEKRYSLVLDISEVFKPVLVDRLIFRLINLGILNAENHFTKKSGGVFLNEEGRKIFIKEFDDFLESTLLHRSLKRKVKYRSLLRLEAYKLIKHLLGEKEYKPLKVWW